MLTLSGGSNVQNRNFVLDKLKMWDHEKIFVLVSPSFFPSCVVIVDHKYQQASPTTDSLLKHTLEQK